MAERNTLHRSKLQEFREWLQGDGWTIEATKGEYEALRARKDKRLLLIYDRNGGDHFSYEAKAHGVVRAFLHSKRR